MQIITILIVFVIDQITKQLAVSHLAGNPPFVIIPDYLQLRYATNLGAAFSMLQGHGLILSLFTIGALAWIAWWAKQTPKDQLWLRFGLSLIFGGATGNLADRLFRGQGLLRGHVVDFIDAHWRAAHWPTFNIADSAICVGVAFVMLALFIYPDLRTQNEPNTPDENTQDNDKTIEHSSQ